MARKNLWGPGVSQEIAALPPRDSGEFAALLRAIEAGERRLSPEAICFLVREAAALGDQALEERLFAVLWHGYARLVAYLAQQYRSMLPTLLTVEDITVDVFTVLFQRLRQAVDVTFYECVFTAGLKQLVLDKVRRLPKEPLTYNTRQDEDDPDQSCAEELADPTAVDPQFYVDQQEEAIAVREELATLLHGLPKKVQATALYMLEGKTQEEIAALIGVSSRMVRIYKRQLEAAFACRVRA